MKNTPTVDSCDSQPAIADGLDIAAVMLLEPQLKALNEAIKAALPAAERLAQASPDAMGLLYDNLLDAVGDGPPMQGSIAVLLDAFSEFTVLLVHNPAGSDVAMA